MTRSIYYTESFPTAPRRVDGRLIVLASTNNIHAAVQESAVAGSFISINQPDIPRPLSATFQAGWQGGDITIRGWDANNQYVTEVIADNPGATVNGTTVFARIDTIEKELVAGTTDTVTIGVQASPAYYSSVFSPTAGGGSLHFETTGTLTGTWTLWRSNKFLIGSKGPNRNDDTDWDDEAAFTASTDYTNPAGAATKWAVEMNGNRSRLWRTKFIPSGGAGTIYCWWTPAKGNT